MNQEKTILTLRNRINVLKESIKSIEDKMHTLEETIKILDTLAPVSVKSELQVVTYPSEGDN